MAARKLVFVGHPGLTEKVCKTVALLSQARGFESNVVNVATSSLAETECYFSGAVAAIVFLDNVDQLEKTKHTLKLAEDPKTPVAVYASGIPHVQNEFSKHQLLFPVCEEKLEAEKTQVFAKALWEALAARGMQSVFPKVFTTEKGSEVKHDEFVMPGTTGEKYEYVQVLENKLLTAPDYDRPSHCLTLDLSNTDFHYNLGDKLTLFPINSEETVTTALTVLGLDGDAVVSIKALLCMADHVLANKTYTVREILQRLLDIQGKATRKFIMSASLRAEDPAEAARLEELALGLAPKNAYMQTSWGVFSYIKVLQSYPSVKMTLDDLLSVVPMIKSRSYSCSSSPLKDPKKAQCTFVVLKYPTKDGEFAGLSSNYLATRKAGDKVYLTIRPNTEPLLLDTNVKYVGVALGSGVALLRGIAEHFTCMKAQGVSPQPMLLYYGVRHRAKDFIYADQFAEYENAGVLKLRSAFSHDQEEFITPATKIAEDPKLLVDYIVEAKNCYFIYCGPAGPAYQSIEAACIKAIEAVHPEMDGQAHIQKLKDAHRWEVQAFTPSPDPENAFA